MIARTKDILFFGVMTMLMIVSLGYGFSNIPSPFDQKDIKLDKERVDDLNTLKDQIQTYHNDNKALPENLTQLKQDPYSTYQERDYIQDPQTKKLYEYTKTGDITYKLCATFAKETQKKKSYDYPYEPKEFTHPKGHHCFDLYVIIYGSLNNKGYDDKPSPSSSQAGASNPSEPIKVYRYQTGW